ncbi:MAG: hypothetical protein DRP87_19730, partial [Spirochaetes bacterium]
MKKIFVSLSVIIILLFSCISSITAETITLYTSVPQNIIDNIKKDFESRNPDINLEIYRSGTNKVLAKLTAEKDAGNIKADVIWVADFSVYENLKEDNLLRPYQAPEAKYLPKEYYDSEGYYYGARLINMVLGYNTRFLRGNNIPDSWFDLLDPRFKNKVGSSSPDRSGAFFVTTGAFATTPGLGWEYFEKFAKQNPASDSNTGIAKKIATGELLMGFVLDYKIRKMKQKGSPIDFVWPKEGAVMVPSPIGIISTTDNFEASKRFVNYSISREGQHEFAQNG